MKNSTLSRSTASFGLSLALCAVLNALLVIAKEKNKAVSDWMQRITGHHWFTHVAIIFIIFVLLGLLLERTNMFQEPRMPARRLANVIVAGVAAGVAIILGFYAFAD